MAVSQHITNCDLILAGRRNFLVRAVGLAAVPLASAPAIAMTAPAISTDLIEKMQKWKYTYGTWKTLYDAHREGRVRLHQGPARVTPEGALYYELNDALTKTKEDLLRAILTDL